MSSGNTAYVHRLASSLLLSLFVLWVVLSRSSVVAQESSLFRQAPPASWSSPAGGVGMASEATASGQGGAVSNSPVGSGVVQAIPQGTPGFSDVALAGASWTYAPPPPKRNFRIQDIVTIRVDELARMRADGAAENRRNTLFDAVLAHWISLRDGNLRPDLQSEGDPRVAGQSNQLYRADSSIESRESLTFSVAARVVDIQPNGNLVLEAQKTIWMNDNLWETSLSGICRAQDIAPDNVILSRDLLDLQIRKNEKGHLRDGYKRGWFTRWLNEFNPF
jgi:flagellar L-ring protein FlgH